METTLSKCNVIINENNMIKSEIIHSLQSHIVAEKKVNVYSEDVDGRVKDVQIINSQSSTSSAYTTSLINSKANIIYGMNAQIGDEISEPEVLFNAPKRNKRTRKKQYLSSKQKNKKCRRLVKINIVHFKCINTGKNIHRKLETYHEKMKIKKFNAGQIQKDLTLDSILKAVSRTRILKKVLANENLLDVGEIAVLKEENIEHNNKLERQPSQDTLTENSELSQNDTLSNKTVNSVIEIINIENTTPIPNTLDIDVSGLCNKNNNENHRIKNIENNILLHRRNVVNVAVAQITNASILKYNNEKSNEQSRELYNENLTSAESFTTQLSTVTSTSSLELSNIKNSNLSFVSSNFNDKSFTLTSPKTSSSVTNKTFSFERTSSHLKQLNEDSSHTLTPNLVDDLRNETEPCHIYFQSSSKSSLLNTIMNVGILQHLPSSNTENKSIENSNKVIIADELRRVPTKRVEQNEKYNRNVIQKSFSTENNNKHQKIINLPNEDIIKTILTETEKSQKKSCSEEFHNYAPFPDMWDKLIVFLDIAIKRMEKSLLSKINSEIKNTFENFEKYAVSISTLDESLKPEVAFDSSAKKPDLLGILESGKVLSDKCTHCGLIQNEVIDDLVLRMNFEEIKDVFPNYGVKHSTKPNVIDDYFEILKPPIGPCTSTEKGDGDSVVAYSAEGIVNKYLDRHQRLLIFLTTPVRFFKENMLVIVSVPMFIFVIFLIYTFLALINRF